MFKKIVSLTLFSFAATFLFAQKQDNSYRIKISDNRNQQYISYDYLFKNDSLKISGISDNGGTSVNYLSLKLKKKHRKEILNYLKTFTKDTLNKEYFDDFFSFGAITSDHFPRVIELEYRLGLKQFQSKATNCYVQRTADLFLFLNQFIPKQEVRIKFNKTDFKKHY